MTTGTITTSYELARSIIQNEVVTLTYTKEPAGIAEGSTTWSVTLDGVTVTNVLSNTSSTGATFTPIALGTYQITATTPYHRPDNGQAMGSCIASITLNVVSGTIIYLETMTIKHQLQANAEDYTSLQWEESTDGVTWTEIEGATDITLTIGIWTGEAGEAETDEPANNAYSLISAYEKYYRCIATNTIDSETKTTTSNTLHVTHSGGGGNPTVT